MLFTKGLRFNLIDADTDAETDTEADNKTDTETDNITDLKYIVLLLQYFGLLSVLTKVKNSSKFENYSENCNFSK
jgi:hypothetical protein